MNDILRTLVASLLIPISASALAAQVIADPALLAEINRIKAIENHAHPLPSLGTGERDLEFNPPDSIPPLAPPVRLRPSNPEYVEAWRALYGYKPTGSSGTHQRQLVEAKQRNMREKGTAYPAWVLDQLGIETMLAARVNMGPGLDAPRFLWVWNVNPLMFPLSNESAKRSNPQRNAGFITDERLLKDFLRELQVGQLPSTLDSYLSTVVVPLLERRKRHGAVAVKFYHAYMRTLAVDNVPSDAAARVYAQFVRGGEPDPGDYKALQDFLLRRIALECGRVGLAVHIHVGAGAGPFFYNSGASPFLLEPILNDPELRGTKFVLVHGGLPFAQATRFLLGKPNVYTDFSSQTFLTSTRELSQVIRSWLEGFPEKVLFGTDAYSLTTTVGWEEIGWIANRSARQALALALTGMMNDGQITRERASELARMVLRENASRL